LYQGINDSPGFAMLKNDGTNGTPAWWRTLTKDLAIKSRVTD
jgi:hypothetical protein